MNEKKALKIYSKVYRSYLYSLVISIPISLYLIIYLKKRLRLEDFVINIQYDQYLLNFATYVFFYILFAHFFVFLSFNFINDDCFKKVFTLVRYLSLVNTQKIKKPMHLTLKYFNYISINTEVIEKNYVDLKSLNFYGVSYFGKTIDLNNCIKVDKDDKKNANRIFLKLNIFRYLSLKEIHIKNTTSFTGLISVSLVS